MIGPKTGEAYSVVEWQRTLGGTGNDFAYSVCPTTNGGFLVVGSTWSTDGDVVGGFLSENWWLVRLDANGDIQWQRSLGGTGYEWATSAQQTLDGGYTVAGWSNSTDGDLTENQGGNDYWVVKLDTTGNIEWQQSLGSSSDDEAYSIWQTTDSGYVVGGYAGGDNGDVTGSHGGFDYWVAKLNATGTLEWQKTLGGSGLERAYAVQETLDHGFIVGGHSSTLDDGDVNGQHGPLDFWVVKLRMSDVAVPEASTAHLRLFPNPTPGSFSIECETQAEVMLVSLLNPLGRTLMSQAVVARSARITVDISACAPGLYLLSIQFADGSRTVERIIKE